MGKKYNFDTFREELVKALEDIYGNRCDVKVRKIPKNTGTELTGISMVIEGDAAGITVYAEELLSLIHILQVWRAVSLDSYARQGKVRFCRRFAGSVIIASAFSLKIKYTAYIRNFLPGK